MPRRDVNMKKRIAMVLTVLTLALAATSVLGDGTFPITVKVGGSVNICKSGTIICPATAPICDDGSVATMRDGSEGMEIVGVGAGQTTCSAMSSSFVRVVYAVTVN